MDGAQPSTCHVRLVIHNITTYISYGHSRSSQTHHSPPSPPNVRHLIHRLSPVKQRDDSIGAQVISLRPVSKLCQLIMLYFSFLNIPLYNVINLSMN